MANLVDECSQASPNSETIGAGLSQLWYNRGGLSSICRTMFANNGIPGGAWVYISTKDSRLGINTLFELLEKRPLVLRVLTTDSTMQRGLIG